MGEAVKKFVLLICQESTHGSGVRRRTKPLRPGQQKQLREPQRTCAGLVLGAGSGALLSSAELGAEKRPAEAD